jgi:hypothetical protein
MALILIKRLWCSVVLSKNRQFEDIQNQKYKNAAASSDCEIVEMERSKAKKFAYHWDSQNESKNCRNREQNQLERPVATHEGCDERCAERAI